MPSSLLGQVASGRVAKRKQVSRKDSRKAERKSKKEKKKQQNAPREFDDGRRRQEEAADRKEQVRKARRAESLAGAKKPVTKPASTKRQREPIAEEESSEEEQEQYSDEDQPPPSDSDDDGSFTISRSKAKSGLQDNDDEIAALEKKLGIKSNKSRKVTDDELDWLVSGGLSSEDEDGFATKKRKRPEDDDWLRDKRRKAEAGKKQNVPVVVEDREVEESEDHASMGEGSEDDIENPFSEDELSEDDFGGFDQDEEDQDSADGVSEPTVKRKRENPYVAPVVASTTKYIPPSMRKPASSDEELLKQLRRQLQGQLNRLSEANLLSILQAIQEIFTKNARQHVTSVLIGLFRDLICDPSVLTETFLILHAGFAAAVYRTTGVDFGAQLLESIVESFDQHHTDQSEGKQTLNLLAFLSNLYTLQAISSDIIFDYIRMLLNNFSEANTELLLRVIRTSGQQLRQDDPSSLKDIVLLLHRSVAALGGESKVSVRTKFMIETIHDLKNNKMKTGLAASSLSAEHMQRMKRTLGTMKNTKTTEPMRITLADIRDSDKKGKWWLVGASYKDPAKMAQNATFEALPTAPGSPSNPSIDPETDPNEIDLESLARSQGMNSPVRIAIFICIAGAEDPHHAFLRIQKLNLKTKQQIENIPRVLLHCVAAEQSYNPYYSIIATKFCADHKMRKAWQFALLDVLRRIGQTADEAVESDDDEDERRRADEMSVRQVYNVANLYATLIAESLLRITVLKPLPFLLPATLSPKAKVFAEVLLATVFISIREKKGKKGFEEAVEECFASAHTVEGFAKGLVWFLEEVVVESKVPRKKLERKAVERGVEISVEVLRDEKRALAAMRKGRDTGEESE